jgi:hypothetical protein
MKKVCIKLIIEIYKLGLNAARFFASQNSKHWYRAKKFN